MFLLIASALATSDYDPTSAVSTFTGEQTFTQDGQIKLWGQIELHQDGDRTLFEQEQFNQVTEWADQSDWAPWIADCFGTNTPHSSAFLLHVAPTEHMSTGTPILLVPGAGDNGSRGFITMATRLDAGQRPVYVLTFAHPHGDVLQQAEIVADAIARIKERRGVQQVDVVAHSKGGIAASVYASNHDGAGWGDNAYHQVGTTYRGDIRRLVLIATPLNGVDTSYRWPASNTLLLDPEQAMAPSSWGTWYPYTTGNQFVTTDLGAQDFLPTDGDLFPGHRQLLRRQNHPLPGSMTWLGIYTLQTDWYTTYEGGFGYWSWSDGIDDAIEAGSYLVAKLQKHGVDPDIEVFLLAGENPLMHNGAEYQMGELFGEAFVDMATSGVDAWAELLAYGIEEGTIVTDFDSDEVRGLAQGKLVLGEISGPSDGVVFIDSATYEVGLSARGAKVVESRVVDLAHLDLLYASPITGQILIDIGESDPSEYGWMRAVGERYVEADTLGWVEGVLADPEVPDTGDTGDDTGDDTGEVEDPEVDTGDTDSSGLGHEGGRFERNCDGCGGGPATGGLAALLGLLLLRRR